MAKTMVSWQAFPSLPPSSRLPLVSLPLSLPFQTPATQANIPPTVDRYITEVEVRRRNIDRYSADSLSHYRPTIDRLSTDYRPTVDRLSTDYRPTVDRLSTDYRPLYRPLCRPISPSTLPTVIKIQNFLALG